MMKLIKLQVGHVITGILLSLFLIVPTSICNDDIKHNQLSTNDTKNSTTSNSQSLKPVIIDVTSNNHTQDKDIKGPETEIQKNITTANPINTKKTPIKINQNDSVHPLNYKPHSHSPELDSGAVTRAFYVFVGLSVIVVSYMVFRSFRLRNSPAQMVRKYGVVAHKQDIEMRPLPLDDDDDDDTTVFDASRLPLHSIQTV